MRTRNAIKEELKITKSVARRLRRALPVAGAWKVPREQSVVPRPHWHPYARERVLVYDGVVEFDLWLDRVSYAKPEPLLCASFGAEEEWGRGLVAAFGNHLRGSERDIRPIRYPREVNKRKLGFSRAPVLESTNDDGAPQYFSRYLPQEFIDAERAFDEFRKFFLEFHAIAAQVPLRVASSKYDVRTRKQDSYVGLLGELFVLSRHGDAEWLGATGSTYDLQTRTARIEVKASLGEVTAPILSHHQIRFGLADSGLFFAFVDVGEEARAILLGEERLDAAKNRVPAWLGKREQQIAQYLQSFGLRLEDGLLARLAGALRLLERPRYYKMIRRTGWATALDELERFGGICEFKQRCVRDHWFRRVKPPS